MSFAIKSALWPKVVAKLFPSSIQKSIIHTYTHLNSLKTWYQRKWIPRKTEPPYTHITQIGDPVLRQKSAPVPLDAIKSKELNFFIDQLVDVLHRYKLVGMAAPQVGIGLQIIVMEFSDRLKKEFTAEEYKVREMEPLPLTVILTYHLSVNRKFNRATSIFIGDDQPSANRN